MYRRISLIAAALLAFLASTHFAISGEKNSPKKPNFVVILADDMGYGDVSPFGGWIKTPNLDRLAKQGMKFTDFHSSGAVCSPTRAGLMTGRYQQRAGIPGVVFADPNRPVHYHGLQASEVTLAEVLRRAGYATAIFGKWHLGYMPKYNPIHHGFDKFNGYVSGNVDFFSHVDQAGNFDWWQQDKRKDEKGYVTHLITKHAVKFIEDNKERPFLLYMPHEAPHYPYQGPNDKALRKVGKPRAKNELKMSQDQRKRAYREMVEELDKSVGAVIAALKKHGLTKNTFIIFFSDNGATGLGSNGVLRGFKGTVWEGGHRVPAIASWPGRILPSSTNASLTISLDVMPTLLSMAGAAAPNGHKFDGVDMSEMLFERKMVTERKLFWQHGNSVAMRDGPWVLVHNAAKGKKTALFNLSNDLAQKNDLSTMNRKRAVDMLFEITRWQKDVRENVTVQPEPPKKIETPQP